VYYPLNDITFISNDISQKIILRKKHLLTLHDHIKEKRGGPGACMCRQQLVFTVCSSGVPRRGGLGISTPPRNSEVL